MTNRGESYDTPSGIPCYASDEGGTWVVGNSGYHLRGTGSSYEEAAANFEAAIRACVAEQAETLERLSVLATAAAQLNGHAEPELRPTESMREGRCLFCGRMRWAVRTLLLTATGVAICNVCVEAASSQIGAPGDVIQLRR